MIKMETYHNKPMSCTEQIYVNQYLTMSRITYIVHPLKVFGIENNLQSDNLLEFRQLHSCEILLENMTIT